MFSCNRDIQVGVFLCAYLHQKALEAQGRRADLSLGLSLGEYNHLVHIGALTFADGLRLVDSRGAVYDRGPAGMMIAVFPLEIEELGPIVKQAQQHGFVAISNFNSPAQHVLSGEQQAVREAIRLVEEETSAQAVVIADGLPMHCSLFQTVAEQFRPFLEKARWRQPNKPYIPNVTGEMLAHPTPADFVELLTQQVSRPVQWRASVDMVAERFPGATFIESGPRAVLFQLLKRWRDNPRFKSDSPEGLVVVTPA
jgi:[acyl-carrier-protein] S-malonyltransferase